MNNLNYTPKHSKTTDGRKHFSEIRTISYSSVKDIFHNEISLWKSLFIILNIKKEKK